MNDSTYKKGALDGLTVFRFAHAFTTGGGVERYLDDLDSVLLERNAMTIIRMHIASSAENIGERSDSRGRGRLIRVACPLPIGEERQISSDYEPLGTKLKDIIRDRILYHPLVWSLGAKSMVQRRPLRRRKGEVVGAGDTFDALCKRHSIDLCMMHFFGGSDADEIIQQAHARGMPIALENHFSNDRFRHLAIRKHVLLANKVAGVNGLDVPSYIGSNFCNLADGIDLSCFDRRHATRPANAPTKAVLFLPARIIRPKGHLDLIRAATRLRQKGVELAVAFAGRVDSFGFVDELKAEISSSGLTSEVLFLGELNPSTLRDWYGASSVLVFPTYHHEGLPRIIIEAQAMRVPVVAYSTGGVAEGIIDGKTGYLVRTGDLDALTDRIGRLLGDESLRRQMGEAGRRFVSERYSLEALAERHEAFYLSLLKRGAGRTTASSPPA